MTPEERRRRFEERLKNATPEERDRMMERMRQFEQRAGQPGPAGAAQAGAAPGTQNARPPAARQRASTPGAGGITGSHVETIDALFGALPSTESFGRVWRYVDGRLALVRVRLGVTDGTNTELISGDLPEGSPVVTGVLLQPAASATQGGGATGARSPLMGPQRGPGGRPGGR